MDSEIQLPVYAESLSLLHAKFTELDGSIVDVSCGTGHMLALYAKTHAPAHELIGTDITPRMVDLTNQRLGRPGTARVGDMKHLPDISEGSVAELMNFIAIHHWNREDLNSAVWE